MILSHASADADRIPFIQKLACGAGQISNVIFALVMSSLVLLALTVQLDVNPVPLGLALPPLWLWEAFIDPVVGCLSDVKRTRWGRGKP